MIWTSTWAESVQASSRRAVGIALVMVILVISALAIIGAPFVVSMMLHDRASQNFSGAIKARQAAESYRNHARARLERSHASVEWEAEKDALEEEREQGGSRRTRLLGGGTSRNRIGRRTSGSTSSKGRVGGGDRGREERGRQLPEGMRVSSKGPSAVHHDSPEEMKVSFPSTIELPDDAPSDPNAGDDGIVSYRDPQGITASVEVTDEQGKINLNSAPPTLIANVFGVGQLARALKAGEDTIHLEDASMFRGDDDPLTIDGAVVVVNGDTGRAEALTYGVKKGDSLSGIFRGAFFSPVSSGGLPAGSFVYDLKGWKLGHHRFWSPRYGGFHPKRLTEMRSVEAMREIAHWQLASLFLNRIHGGGLTKDLLARAGVRAKGLAKVGFDPSIFDDPIERMDVRERSAYRRAKSALAKQRFDSRLLKRLEERRGPHQVLELATRLRGAKRREVKKVEKDVERLLAQEKSSRRKLDLDSRHAKRVLNHLAEVYEIAGIETILPEDLEYHRDAFTVSSRRATRWSEPQALIGDLSTTGPTYSVGVPRASDFGPGTIVRLRRHDSRERSEFNVVTKSAGAQTGSIELAYPPRSSYKAYRGTVEALERHFVNVNSASRRVLRAVFTGVRGLDRKSVVTPYEADRLAGVVYAARPIESAEQLLGVFTSAAGSDVIDDIDVDPLFINAVQPNSYFLGSSTTGFVYATGDSYTIESRSVLRSPAGKEVAHARFREIVDVSPAGVRQTGLVSQVDFTAGVYLRSPHHSPRFPEVNHRFLLRFPGSLSHLMQTRPLLLHRQERVFAGADVSSLRLFTSQTPQKSLEEFTSGEVMRFEDTYEGLELERGEPYVIEIPSQSGGAGGGVGGLDSEGSADLTTVPAGFEFWVRMKTYPVARSRDGFYKLVDSGGGDPERNRLVLLYDDSRGRVLFRIYDSAFPDPLLRNDRESGSFLEIEALRPLELDVWYHIKLVWDGVFGGGAQLFVDGVPVGKDNLSSELTGAIPATGTVNSISVRDASKFPPQGSVRVGAEIFEYVGRSGSTLRLRQMPPSHWKPLPMTGFSGAGGLPGSGAGSGDSSGFGAPGGVTGGATGGGAGSPQTAQRDLRVQNGRGSAPTAHAPGELVTLHGYSLEIRRKISPSTVQVAQGAPSVERQVGDGDAQTMVWGPGGLALAEPLHAWSFPTSVESRVVHYFCRFGGQSESPFPGIGGNSCRPPGNVDPGGLPGGIPGGGNAGGGNTGPGDSGEIDEEAGGIPARGWVIVPLFKLAGASGLPGGVDLPGGVEIPGGVPGVPGAEGGAGPGGAPRPIYTGQLPDFARTTADYFQSKGVVFFQGRTWRYQREALPAEYAALLQEDPKVQQPPAVGLRLVGPYPGGVGGVQGLTVGGNQGEAPVDNEGREQGPVLQLSLLANGAPTQRYPSTGVLEVRGVPSPWELQAGRPSLLGGPLMGQHPDDTVEWLRYVAIEENLFVGRLSQDSNFRGYPVRERYNYLKKQLDHPGGQPLRLVMELSEGGAGWGDYVTIVTNDPNVYEPGMRRVYKAFEHEDGRFFVSLVDVDQNGKEMSISRGTYRNAYFRAMNPRLVKFPSWGLPQMGTGNLTLFGDGQAIRVQGGGGSAGGSVNQRNRPDMSARQYDDESTGITIDEVRRFENRRIAADPIFKTRARFALVPLKGGRVQVGGSAGRMSIGGAIPKTLSISRSSPVDIYVVTVSTERRGPTIFARGLDDGVLRIGSELFFFESVEGSGQPGNATRGTTREGGYDPSLAGETTNQLLAPLKERLGESRMTYERIQTSAMSGHFEPQGFASLRDADPERADFFEIFYYGGKGGGFTDCLRGQFNTPYLQTSSRSAGQIRNVTQRLRLIGRSLLGTEARTHGVGAPVALVPYLTMSPITGPITDSGLPVKRPQLFADGGGYVLIDSGVARQPKEIVTHTGSLGEGQLLLPLDQRGERCLRARFGTQPLRVGPDMFAYELPFRYFDRYEPEVESESLAFLQKSFRVPGAYWRSIEWRERAHRLKKERLVDVIIVGRFDGEPDWDVKADERGSEGLYLFEARGRKTKGSVPRFEIDRPADEFEIRVYFRYKSSAYMRLQGDLYRDDWKQTPVLESLIIEYEKDGAIVRHEELPR